MAEHAQLKVVFVVAEARTVKQQQQLLGEHRVHGDIVQSSVQDSASKSSIRRFVITEKAPTRAFSWLKAATTAFTFKTLLRH